MRAGLIIFLILIGAGVSAQAKPGASDTSESKEKTYSEAEFHQALLKAVSERLVKLGNGKIVDFSKELLERERQLDVQEQALKRREQAVGKLNRDFATQVKVFQEKQTKFLACLDETEQKERNRLTHMVDVISGMKPSNAAEVLSVQDASISVQILGELDPIRVSKIFNLMDKEISARLQKQYLTMKK